ncbi:DUF4153 domain-containing protein [Streptosporangium lutulentum]|uniref:Signal transduction histidine-protein kinase/phosphatase MprB n=1 Tax=Streptosporangium lutulentum TaxID=1461250 RepID=A0ABT9QHS6_9ACTN|nr:DUF4153 domain-containing protein [Streptosporangium lutulentum]MDP9846315.1 signal transduction histidine kinase [Streptosporangium lutulentum]
MRPLDFLGRIKVKLGMVILLAVAAAFVVNEVGINAGYSRNVRVAVAVVFALIMMQLLARGMTKPLREMAAAAQTIAKGRYGLRVTATSRDEVGELARAFNAMAADLGEVDRQRRELVANVSHELRTPITALRAVLENVVDGVSDPDPVTLGTALAQTERLGRLVAQLLDLSRLESGSRLIELDDVELRPLCEQALREAVLAREGVTARCEVPEGLSLRADSDLLAQVLANLLDNAVRHSPEGGVVVLAAAVEGDGVRLRVTDRGPGIPVEDRARAFERFSRLDAGRAADDGGAGLGLAITKEIVELHGGSIHVEDGVGCQIVADLPGRIMMDTPLPSPASTGRGSPAPAGDHASEDPEVPAPSVPASEGTPPEAAETSGPRDVPGGEAGHPSELRETAGAVRASKPRDVFAAGHPSGPREAAEAGEAFVSHGALATAEGPGTRAVSEPVFASPDPGPPAHGAAAPATRQVTPPRFPPTPVLMSGGDAHRPGGARQERVRNWLGAFLGLVVGGVFGLVCGGVAGLGLAMLDLRAGLLAGSALVVIGAFVGTVIGATTPAAEFWSGHQTPLPHRPPARGPGATVTVPRPGPRRSESEPPRETAGETAQPPGGMGGQAGPGASRTPATSEKSVMSEASPVTSGGTGELRSPRDPWTSGGSGGYEAPPIFPRPDLPDTPKWVLPVIAAVGLLAAFAVPYSRAGLGLVLVAVAMGAAALPAVRGRITPWSAAMGAIAYGMVAVAMFRDANWLVGLLLLAGFLTAALALSGAGRGWLGVIRGGASVILGLVPVPWFLGPQVKGMAVRRRLTPLLIGGGLTVVLVGVFGALFASADAIFAQAVQRVFSAQDWAGTVPLRILIFVVFGLVVASAVLVGLRPVVEPETPNLRVTVSRGLWVTPLTALNLLFATFVGMQLTVLFGSTDWVASATGLTYAEYARSGFFQLVVVSVFVLAIVAVASGVVELRGLDRWLMAGLLGVLCALTMVILFSALHRLDLYAEVYGLSRLRASVEATVWWLGGVFVLVLIAGAVRLTGRGNARWLPRTAVVMTSAALLAFAVWNPDLRVAETQLSVRGVDRIDLEYLGGLGAEAVPALDRLPEPSRSCVLRDVVEANELAEPDPWNGWNLARRQAREVLERRPVLKDASCPQTLSRLEAPYRD